MLAALLVNSQSKPTGERLSEELGIPLMWRRDNLRRHPLKTIDCEVVVRWGAATAVPATLSLNSPRAIQLAANKLATIEILSEKNIPTLKLTYESPCIVRTIHHSRGKGLWVCPTGREKGAAFREGGDYAVAIYPKTREFRVHVGSGMVLFVQEKLGDKNQMVWNKDQGFHFKVIPQNEWRRGVVELGIKAVNALGLDFGAVDIITDPNPKDKFSPTTWWRSMFGPLTPDRYPEAVVCEVNTAPALEGYSLLKYVQYFKDALSTDTLPIPLQVEKRYAKSYRYKDYKLDKEEI